MAKILKRCILAGKKVLYKPPIDIAPLSSSLDPLNEQFLFSPNYSNGHNSDTWPKKMLHKFTYCYTFVPIYGSKLQNLGGQKIPTTFWHLKISHLSAQ